MYSLALSYGGSEVEPLAAQAKWRKVSRLEEGLGRSRRNVSSAWMSETKVP